MATLRRTGPAIASPGTLVAPVDGTAVALAAQLMVEGYGGLDVESLLIPTIAAGAPATDGSVVSLFYFDSTAMVAYIRTSRDPVVYRPMGSGAGGTPNAPASGMPSIAGMVRVGEELTAGVGTLADRDGLPDVSQFMWQWFRGLSPIAGAMSRMYTIAADDVGFQLFVRAIFTDDDGNAEAADSAATVRVPAPQTHTTHYFGWSADRVIETADLVARAGTNGVSSVESNEGAFPPNDAPMYGFIALPSSLGVPSGVVFPPGTNNQIAGWPRQAGTVDDSADDAHIVLVSEHQLVARATSRSVRVEYPS